MALNNVIGKPVRGENFFGREVELETLWRYLETDHVLLLAPRRVGKTSLMHRLADEASARDFVPIYESVADVTSERAFVKRLFEAITRDRPNKFLNKLTRGSLGRYTRSIRKLGIFGLTLELDDEAAVEWTRVGETLTQELSGLEGNRLFLIDELPIFILSLLQQDPSGQRARIFLDWFRQRRIDSRCESLRWLLAGSIGLDAVARRLNMGDTINDLRIYHEFGPFSRQTADDFLDALADSYEMVLTDPIKNRICERTGWLIPYHLQLYFGELRDHIARSPEALTPAAVDAAHERLLSPSKRGYFDYWEQRLHKELGSVDSERAITILDAAASDPRGTKNETLSAVLHSQLLDERERKKTLSYLLDVLCGDGYLVREEQRYRFRSSLLRDYWQRRGER